MSSRDPPRRPARRASRPTPPSRRKPRRATRRSSWSRPMPGVTRRRATSSRRALTTGSPGRCTRPTPATTAPSRSCSRPAPPRRISTACARSRPRSSPRRFGAHPGSIGAFPEVLGRTRLCRDVEAGGGSAVSADSFFASGHPALTAGATLTQIASVAAGCDLCKLAPGRTQVVFGVGRDDADLLLVGEGPGEQEDLRGEPFVGRAGQLLTQLIEGIGLTRDDVYIANVVKRRPPGKRYTQPDEIEACAPWLDRQMELIKPRVITTLGNFA